MRGLRENQETSADQDLLVPAQQDLDFPEKPPNFFIRIFTQYDTSFVANLALLYVNGGFKVLYTVALQEIGKTVYGLSPDALQLSSAFVLLPWDFKILYGITCDTIALPGFKDAPKKGYLILFSTIQCFCLFWAGIYQFESWYSIPPLFFMCSLCGAFMDVVIDGLSCILQRNDPVNGASDLQSWAWGS
jgi:hypothetical protein